MKSVDVVVPVRNEGSTVAQLARQLDTSLKTTTDNYKLIFIVDPSTDSTVDALLSIQKDFPVLIENKKGKPGKGYSLIEGIEKSDADYVVFIDGDLQYPTSIIPQMVEMLNDEKIGVVVANRVSYQSSLIRRIGSRLNRFIFGKLLLGFGCDIQSGLKVFRRSIFQHVDKSLIGPWTFDIPLLHTALQLGYQIGEVDIEYAQRTSGKSKVKVVKTAFSIASCAIKTAAKEHRIFHLDHESKGVHGSIMYKKNQFTPHTLLPHHKSAIVTATRVQQIIIGAIFLLLIGSFIAAPLKTAIVLTAILTFIYFSDVLFSVYLILKSLHFPPELSFTDEELKNITDDELPIYSVLCPLYKEAQVLPQFVEAMEKMDYPKTKMDILILLEENDLETIEVANKMNLPEYYRIVVVPHSQPKTKPKACNYGIHLAKGEYMVVYDAEDIPEPKQLKKGYLAFKRVSPKVICVQAKLNYYNPHQNLLTTLFTAEYSLWFDVILPGLQSINTIIPLGGTSNHFRTQELLNLHAWDPFNVTEDCDLGVRLFKDGYKTEIMDSTTLEEANSNVKNWIRQRSRWIKGYLQTYLVHMRDPWKFVKQHKWHALIFQLIIGLRISFILINPFLWAMTIAYFTLYRYVGPTIEALYPAPVFYMAAFALVFGNFMYLYNYMIGLAKRGHWDVIKFVFVVPFYWAMMGISATIAFWQLIFKPHFWEKTHHGLHLSKTSKKSANHTSNAFIGYLPNIKKYWDTIINNTAGKSLITGGSLLIFAGLLTNFINYLFNAYLSRKLDFEDFGLVSLFGSLVFISTIPLSALTRTITYKSAYYFGKYKIPVYSFWKQIRKKTLLISFIFTVVWIIFIPFLKYYFNSDSYAPFVIFTPVIIITSLSAVDSGYLSGNLNFITLAVIMIIAALVKMITAILIVELGYVEIIYLSITLSFVVSYFIGYYTSKKIKPQKPTKEAEISFSNKFFLSSVLVKFSIISYISLDLILAQHYLTPSDAGRYALVALVGKMIFFIGNLFTQFVTPLISHNEGAKKDTSILFKKIFYISALASIAFYTTVGIFGYITTPFLFGNKMNEISYLLPVYGFGMLCFTLSSTIVNYHQVKEKHVYTAATFVLSLMQIVLFVANNNNLGGIVNIMTLIGILNLITTFIISFFWKSFENIQTNLIDFFGAFFRIPDKSPINTNSLNILVFNWRDIKHVWSGGAEVYVHELSRRLVHEGHKVTLFCGNDKKCPRYEEIDGIQIVRRGGFYTVYIWAFLYYVVQFRNKYDVIIDSENGIPFFTPLYVKKPIIGLIHHVHRDIILKELKLKVWQFPFAVVAKFLESEVMPYVYSDVKMITVSASSKKDMEKLGFGRNTKIDIINPGIDPLKFHQSSKTDYPSILYLGRIKAYKRIDTLIYALPAILNEFPTTKLRIAGFGEHQKQLEDLSQKLGVKDSIEFLGKVTEEDKIRLYAESWIFAYPSSMEGWGISIIEANASGTPVIASKVPGLVDSVNHLKTGYLVNLGNHKEFAHKITYLFKKDKRRHEMGLQGIKWAERHTWDISTEKLILCIQELIRYHKIPNISFRKAGYFETR